MRTIPGWVYRAYDANGRLLYVGSTVNVGDRLRYHEGRAPWWLHLSAVTTESFEDIRVARQAELAAINSEHPRWNVVGRSPEHPDGFIPQHRGRFAAPWLRDEIAEWRRHLRAASP